MTMTALVINIAKSLFAELEMEGSMKKSVEYCELLTKNRHKIEFAENLLKEHNLLPNYNEFMMTKCNEKAEEFKCLGNKLYRDKKFHEALVNYNKSLCYSPVNSPNVGIAFANRSAVYFVLGQHEKCIENIKLAKIHNYPKEKIDNLNKREKHIISKLNHCPDPNQELIKYEAARERFLKPKLKAKDNLGFFVADCLELKTSPEFGRHLITNEDLKVGSVIVVEKPFSKIVGPAVIYERCANCLEKNVLSLIPCLNCCSAMFCSEDCRNDAQEKFHKYECGLVDAIDKLVFKLFRLVLRTYSEALQIFGTPSKLREFLDSIKDSNATILDFDYTDEASSRKNLLHSIDTLMTFEKSQRCDAFDLFATSIASAIMCNLMLNHSQPLKALLVDDEDQDFFREFIFKYYQITALNFQEVFKFCKKGDSRDQILIGSGSFPFVALLNHNCAPNVARIQVKTSAHIVVVRPIKKGEQIMICYAYNYNHFTEPLASRQKELFGRFRFKCQCKACLNDYPTLPYLKIKNVNLYEAVIEERLYFEEMKDLDEAVENYDKSCKRLDALDKEYPSYELTEVQGIMRSCLRIFSKNEWFDL